MKLEEVAKLTGVSRSTVSRVVNNDPNVNEMTRERVMKVIKKVNYHPNTAARGLAAGRTNILGVVIPTGVSTFFADPFFPILIQGISSACNTHDHSIMLWLAEPEYERRMIRRIMGGGLIDGVIVSSMLMDDPIVQALIEGEMPFVLVGRHPSNTTLSYVDVDNLSGARDAVLHILRLGRKRIATITGPHNVIAGADRLQGYLNALRERGQASDPNLIIESDFTEVGGYEAMRRLLPQNPDAVFVASDAMAVGALRALREASKRVPEDVALIGFDDLPFAARSEPPLTTVRQPIQRMGALAAEMLISLIEQPKLAPQRILLPAELAIRTTCGYT